MEKEKTEEMSSVEETEKQETRLKKARRAINILMVLLVLLLILLLCLKSCGGQECSCCCCCQCGTSSEAVSPGNHISVSDGSVNADGDDAVIFYLYKHHAEDGEPISVQNMFPGDSVSKQYTVFAGFTGTLDINFTLTVRDGYEKLAQVLMARLTNVTTGELLYEGPIQDADGQAWTKTVTAGTNDSAVLTYDITLYLSTDVGNEYMSLPLIADLRWWTDNDDLLTTEKQAGQSAVQSSDSGTCSCSGGSCGQRCGGCHACWWTFASIVLLVIVLLQSLAIAVLVTRRRKDDESRADS